MFLITILIALVGLVLYIVTYIINRNEYEKARKKRIKSPHSEVISLLFRVDSNSKISRNNHAQFIGIVSQNTSLRKFFSLLWYSPCSISASQQACRSDISKKISIKSQLSVFLLLLLSLSLFLWLSWQRVRINMENSFKNLSRIEWNQNIW